MRPEKKDTSVEVSVEIAIVLFPEEVIRQDPTMPKEDKKAIRKHSRSIRRLIAEQAFADVYFGVKANGTGDDL